MYVTHDYVEAVALRDRIGGLREGRILQVGTREELWNRPVDTFVARTFGQPEINLIRGALVEGGRFRSQDAAIELPVPRVRARANTDVLLGVRPRDLSLADGDADLRGRVWVIERLGRDREITVEVGRQRLQLLASDAGAVREDAEIGVSVPADRVLLFEESGRRIEVADGA